MKSYHFLGPSSAALNHLWSAVTGGVHAQNWFSKLNFPKRRLAQSRWHLLPTFQTSSWTWTLIMSLKMSDIGQPTMGLGK
ncbi:hypothetical protein FA15DRAFT_675497 [Coprinopsis marcescibilis]|uniref:Uncharacterized protein n=1 Tax=Coprinopsis marcescibilis TaxID=230819 RepID=A0A5C3KEG3_COPMA|nr:hypothetical protein FA15DRAFT_675497 [Coprinopsis marcescibilis]